MLRRTGAEYLIFSGGRTNRTLPWSECTAMQTFARRAGVDPSRIRLETRALDTIGNGFFTRILVDELPVDTDTVHLVTSTYHAERATYVFEQCFGDGYEVVAVEASTAVSERGDEERRRLRQARSFFDGIPPGELDSIRRRMGERHDYYDEPP